jgi:hypothetical protein
VLFHARAAALDQKHQHNDKRHTRNNPSNGDRIHCDFSSPFNFPITCHARKARLTSLADLAAAENAGPALALLHPRAPALHKKRQHHDKQHSGNDPDDSDAVHNFSSFPQ